MILSDHDLKKLSRKIQRTREHADQDAHTQATLWEMTELRLLESLIATIHAQNIWQPIATAPRDGTLIIGALLDSSGKVWRVTDMQHNGLAFYTINGHSLPVMTHWRPLPALA